MNMHAYQKLAARTLISKPGFEMSDTNMMVLWCTIGLSVESGEVAEHVKKGIFHQHGLDIDTIKKELGDCLWYIAGICTTLGIDLNDIVELNINKLRERYPNGYSSLNSINRKEYNENKDM